MKKKILFIALHYPPSEGIADIRATNIVSQLSKNEFDVTVLTLNKNYYSKQSKKIVKKVKNIDTIRVNYFLRLDAGNVIGNTKIPKILRRSLLRLLPYFGLDYLFFWQKNAIREVLKKNKKYDFIIATGPPFSNFLLAKRLSKILSCRYIIDYRDPWTLSAHGLNSSKNIINNVLEREILKKASLIIFNSPSMKKVMLDKFKINKSVVITNGFDLSDFQNIPERRFEKFTISYVGNFYIPKRTIDPLFQSLKKIKEDNKEIYKNISFIYCGRAGEYINLKSIEYGIEDIVINRQLVTRDEAFSITKNSNLSVIISTVFNKSSISERSIIPGKVFEALAMNTTILCISPPQSDIREVVSRNNRGYIVSGTEINKLTNFIVNDYMIGNKNMISDNNEFQWKNLIKKLIKKLN